MKRDNFDFENESQDRINAEMNRRKHYMHSIKMYDMALFFLKHRYDLLTTKKLEDKFALSRTSLLSTIGNLRCIHGLKIINEARKGTPALYRIVGFEQPKGRGHTGKKRKPQKRKILSGALYAKPETFNPLIESVFK